jgi:tetratricopeptide (TPR) repeat protein
MKDFTLFDTAKTYTEQGDYEKASQSMKAFLKEVEAAYSGKRGEMFSFNHILEVYYFRFFKNAGENDIQYAPLNIGSFYRFYGYILLRLQRYGDAITAYENALDWNPVDLDSLFQLSELYKKTKDLRHTLDTTWDSYNYCCSRATLAHFYRNLGFYYLESYQPDIATALYLYSNIFSASESASRDLAYLEKALKRPTPGLSIRELQAVLRENKIPVGPNPDTVGITFRTGQLEFENQHYDTAKDCFLLVYDLTQDKEAEAYLDKL